MPKLEHPQEAPEFIRRAELARRLRTTPATIALRLESGDLPLREIRLGASRLYRLAEVNAWLAGEIGGAA